MILNFISSIIIILKKITETEENFQMAKVLYITAHPFNELVSNSMAAGKAFIETYQQQHPDDEVKHIDLFETYIPVIDKDVLTGWGKMSNGETLTDDEQMKVSRLSDI